MPAAQTEHNKKARTHSKGGETLQKKHKPHNGTDQQSGAALPKFSEGLSSLRGIAASIVIFYHALLVFQVTHHGDPNKVGFDFSDPWLVIVHGLIIFLNGNNAVILFFVLSGTVLAMSFDRQAFNTQTVGAYYVRRTFRIMPILVASAVAAALLHKYWFPDIQMEAGTPWSNNYYRHDPGKKEVLLNAIGWSNSLNSPAWTIRIEILASIVFPALYLAVGGSALVTG
ncbi:MAG: acyltransferase, partial [Pseudomonadota bacterium]